MKLTSKSLGKLSKTPALVLFRCEGEAASVPAKLGAIKLPPGFLESVSSDARQVTMTHAVSGPAERVIFVGLGSCVDAEALRRAAAVAVGRLEQARCASGVLAIGAGSLGKLDHRTAGIALAEGATLGAYRYDGAKTGTSKAALRTVSLMGPDAAFARGVQRGRVSGAACAFTRDLQNGAGNMITPRRLAAEARKLASASPSISCKVLDEKAMEKLGMGLLLSVSRGSVEPARLIHLTYKPKGRARGKVALVGKGLTFDAGGISLKPSGKMDEMRYDMSGGAAVLGVFHALASLNVPVEVHGIVPSSENMPDAAATKPGDVFKAMNGKTVEVLNTDAEGRLILADALAYTEKKVKPDTIIDLATLTGAVIVALGHELSGIFPSSDGLRDALVEAGEATGEAVWPMPLLPVHRDGLKGMAADLKNIASPAMGAGSTVGAAFLSHFVDQKTDWCHVDIAGTAWGSRARDWVGGPMGSGVGTRLLIHYLEGR